MRRLVFVSAGLAATFLGTSATATAEPEAVVRPVVEVRVLGPQTCVHETQLGDQLRRAGIYMDAEGNTDAVVVEVVGTPQSLTAHVGGGGRDVTTALASTRCETATDVVAAFIVSALAPAPTLSDSPADATMDAPTDRLRPEELRTAVNDALARRGVQLAEIRRRLDFRSDASGTFFVEVVSLDAPECSRVWDLGVFDVLSPDRLEVVLQVVNDAIDSQQRCLARPVRESAPPPVRESARVRAVRDAVESVHDRATWTNVEAATELGSGATLLTFLIYNKYNHDNSFGSPPHVYFSYASANGAFMTSASLIAMGGGGVSFFLDEDSRPTVVGVTSFAAIGAFFTSAAIYHGSIGPDYPFATIAVGSYATAGLVALNAALARPPIHRLRTVRDRMGSSGPSDAIVASAESDLARLETPISSYLTYAPLAAGGIVAAISGPASKAPESSQYVLIGGGIALIGALGMFLPEVRYRRPPDDGGITDVSFGVGPGDRGGFSISGRF